MNNIEKRELVDLLVDEYYIKPNRVLWFMKNIFIKTPYSKEDMKIKLYKENGI